MAKSELKDEQKSNVPDAQEKEDISSSKKIYLQTHKNIQEQYAYNILTLKDGFARVETDFKHTQTIDENGSIFDGSIFLAANFTTIAAVNRPNTIVVDAKVKFYTPIKRGDRVIFEASSNNTKSNKQNIDIVGMVNDIIVFEGNFTTIRLDKKSLV